MDCEHRTEYNCMVEYVFEEIFHNMVSWCVKQGILTGSINYTSVMSMICNSPYGVWLCFTLICSRGAWATFSKEVPSRWWAFMNELRRYVPEKRGICMIYSIWPKWACISKLAGYDRIVHICRKLKIRSGRVEWIVHIVWIVIGVCCWVGRTGSQAYPFCWKCPEEVVNCVPATWPFCSLKHMHPTPYIPPVLQHHTRQHINKLILCSRMFHE